MDTFLEFLDNDYNRNVYCDMDGVLANFVQGTKDLAGVDWENDSEEEMWRKVSKVENFFQKLPLLPDAKELWNHITKNQSPYVLSTAAILKGQDAAEDKRKWMEENFEGYKDIIIVYDNNKKAEYAQNYGGSNILIDDREKCIIPWMKNGGIGVLHSDSASTIQKLQQYGVT